MHHPLTSPGLIHKAVLSAESLIYNYPTRFHDIEEAKAHISRTVEAKNFRYGCPSDVSDAVYADVRDKVLFRVAVRALEQKEFYLDVGLPDRQALRGMYSLSFLFCEETGEVV
jgi:hypothetical protein